ncbi:MAG: hypothetical protein AB7I36_17300 [Rhodospirillaceae bacterium]
MAEAAQIPTLLERAQVPAHFPLFRNTASLAHLAHIGKGPPYVLVGGKAWYEIADITAWIDSNKVQGAPRAAQPPLPKAVSIGLKKRGRPTKMEQYFRKLRPPTEIAD